MITEKMMMARRLSRSLQRASSKISSSSSSNSIPQTSLIQQQQQQPPFPFPQSSSSSSSRYYNNKITITNGQDNISNNNKKKKVNFLYSSRRSYIITEMRHSAFEGNMLRLLRNEIQYQLQHSPPNQPVPEFNSFTVDERPGEPWIRLSKKFGEDEEINVEVTMLDGSAQKKAAVGTDYTVELPISMIVNIFKGSGNSVLKFVCSAWPNCLVVQKLFVARANDRIAGLRYMGPIFRDLNDDLQESLYDYLETRGIGDELATFLHGYIKNKDKSEYIRWMETVKSFIENKQKSLTV